MIKIHEIGMLDNAVNVPDKLAASDIANYSFIAQDGETYLVANTINGDKSYEDNGVIKAGEYMNLFLVRAWDTKELEIDAKHIDGDYADITAGTTLLKVASDGGLEIASSAPASGVYFKVTKKISLTGDAVLAKIMVA